MGKFHKNERFATKENKYLRVVEEIKNSSSIKYTDKQIAISSIDKYAKGELENIKFAHDAETLTEMFDFKSTYEGWFFWSGIRQNLRGKIQ